MEGENRQLADGLFVFHQTSFASEVKAEMDKATSEAHMMQLNKNQIGTSHYVQ